MMAALNSDHRGRLRTATQAAHARVDACFPRGLHDVADYRRYLCGMHALVEALESALAQARLLPEWIAWRRPERVHWLRDDLAAVGATPLRSGPALPLGSTAEAVGALYVVEGSALGATQLLKDARSMGWNERNGAHFLHRHGGETAGGRWRDFIHNLERARFDLEAEAALFDAAARTFAYAEHEFLRAAHQGSE